MELKTLHPELEADVESLSARIVALKSRITRESNPAKIEDAGQLVALEQQHSALAQRLHALNQEGPGFHQSVKAECIVIADDLSRMIESLWLKHENNHPSK